MKKLHGCGTALVTPFTKNLEVDYKTYRKLVIRQIKNKVHFLVPLGTTGETPCLEEHEKIQITEITVEAAADKIPVIVGASSNSTKQTINNIQLLDKIGVDGFLVVTPYYNKPTQQGLYNHFKAVAETTNKPIIMYNVPGRTGVNMTAETCLKLAEIKNIIATKEASSNYSQISEIIRNSPKHFSVFSGNDDETLALMATGAKGVISVASNIAPKEVSKLAQLLLDGSYPAAQKLHHLLSILFKNCFVETSPIPVKAGMYKMGLIENVLRPPLYPATAATLALIEKTLKLLSLSC
jgi:4-hydroxy-tetrahydrodipicolinate synthase